MRRTCLLAWLLLCADGGAPLVVCGRRTPTGVLERGVGGVGGVGSAGDALDDALDGMDEYEYEDEPELLPGTLEPALPLRSLAEGRPATSPPATSRLALTFFRRELSIAAETPTLVASSTPNLIVLAPLGSGGTPVSAPAPPALPSAVSVGTASVAPMLARREHAPLRLRRSAIRASATARSSSVTFTIWISRSGSSYSCTVGAAALDDDDGAGCDCDWRMTPILTRT